MPSAQDPFYVVKEEIQGSVSFLLIMWFVTASDKEISVCSRLIFLVGTYDLINVV